MTTFQPVILQCPICKQKMYSYELMSYTVYSSTVYSDSKCITEPFMDTDRAISICESCKQPFWTEDSQIETENPYELVDELPKAADIYDLPEIRAENYQENLIKYYEKLIKTGFAYNNEKRYYLRIRLWWGINDLVRHRSSLISNIRAIKSFKTLNYYVKSRNKQRKIFNQFKRLFVENLIQLTLQIDPVTDDDHIMLAEMFRESGNFRKAKKSLKMVNESNGKAVKKIRKKVFFRIKKVFQI